MDWDTAPLFGKTFPIVFYGAGLSCTSLLFSPSSFSWLQRWVYLKAQLLHITLCLLSYSLSSDCHRMTPKPTALAWTFLLISRSFCFIVLLSFKMCYSSSSITFLVFSDTEPFSWFLSLGVTVTHFQWWKYFRCYWFQAFAHYPISNHASTSHSWAYLTIVRYFFTCSLPVTRIYPYSPLFSRSWYWNLRVHICSPWTEVCSPRLGLSCSFRQSSGQCPSKYGAQN